MKFFSRLLKMQGKFMNEEKFIKFKLRIYTLFCARCASLKSSFLISMLAERIDKINEIVKRLFTQNVSFKVSQFKNRFKLFIVEMFLERRELKNLWPEIPTFELDFFRKLFKEFLQLYDSTTDAILLILLTFPDEFNVAKKLQPTQRKSLVIDLPFRETTTNFNHRIASWLNVTCWCYQWRRRFDMLPVSFFFYYIVVRRVVER